MSGRFCPTTGETQVTDVRKIPVRRSIKRDTAELAGFVRDVCLVVKMLREQDATMTYGDLSVLIGLRKESDPWSGFRFQVRDILVATADLSNIAGDDVHLDLSRIVDARTGQPGKGFARKMAELAAGEGAR
jgi:hypothetical protein